MESESKPKKWALISVVGAACLLIATACGSESTSAASTSPIDEYLGTDLFDDFNPQALEQDYNAYRRQAEEAIAACMNEQGFEYDPPAHTVSPTAIDQDNGLERGSKEWTTKYGFGITTQAFGQSQVGPELAGYDDSFSLPEEQLVDPNQEYIDALDEASQDAFYIALYGDDALEDADESIAETNFDDFDQGAEPIGCQAEAYDESSSEKAFYKEFDDDLNQLYSAVEGDPRFETRVQEVSSCVTESGYRLFAGWPNGISDDGVVPYEAELQVIWQLVEESGPENLSDDVDFASMSEEDIGAIFAEQTGGPELTPEAKTRLAELQTDEIETALAAYECDGGEIAISDFYRELLHEYENRFVETHKDKLDAFKVDHVVAE